MSNVQLATLVSTAGDILRLEHLLDHEQNPREWKEVKKALPLMKERFSKLKHDYVDMVLKDFQGDEAIDVPIRELGDYRANADKRWHPAIEYTLDNLIPYLTKESKKSPGYRKAVKMAPWVIASVCVLAYFGVRLLSVVEISAPLASRAGLEQRAAAMGKFVLHDDFMHTDVRRGGWLKGLMFWPIEPTEAELAGATEFAGLTLQALQILRDNDQVCSDLVIGQGETLSKDEIRFAGEVAEYVRSVRMKWTDEPELDIATPLRALAPCKSGTP